MPAPKSIDYTQLPPPPPPAKPPAAAPTIAVNRLPIPTGMVQINKASPMEEKRLKEMGWDGKSPVPANLLEISDSVKEQLRQVQEQTDQEALQDTLARAGDKGPLQVQEQDMRDLSPALQAQYQMIMDTILEKAAQQNPPMPDVSGMDPSVASAVRAAHQAAQQPAVVDDMGAANYATGAPQPKLSELARAAEPPIPVANQPSQENKDLPQNLAGPDLPEEQRACARCGFPKHKTEDIEVSEDDKSAYFQAVIGLQPFIKTVPLFSGKANVTIRTLDPQELDELYVQLSKDVQAGLIPSFAAEMELTARYRLTMQLVELGLPEAHRRYPRRLLDWHPAVSEEVLKQKGKLRCVLEMVMQDIGANESIYRLLSSQVAKFNVQVQRMEKLVTEPDFWKAVGT